MVQIEGTYSIVKDENFAKLYEKLGLSAADSAKLVRSHWTMNVWRCDLKTWGVHFKCQEVPILNCLEVISEGEEKMVNNPMFGGSSKVSMTLTEDGFITNMDSEKCGSIKCVEHFFDDGVKMEWIHDKQSYFEKWDRVIEIDGAYKMDREENMVDYFSALAMGSDELARNLSQYKAYFKLNGNSFELIESFGALGLVSNTLILDEKRPFYVPGEDVSVPTERTGHLTNPRCGHYVLVIHNPDNSVEEWTFTFDGNNSLRMTGLEKSSGKTCWMELSKFIDICGTFKIFSSLGLEKFSLALGVPIEQVKLISDDDTARIEISDVGGGWFYYKFSGKVVKYDYRFKLDQQFEFDHPVLNIVQGVATMHENIMEIVLNSEKGLVKTKMIFNKDFLICDVSFPGPKLAYTSTYMKI